ncbi:hypothetical protein CPC16_007370 [Podila verticillata]|nr:hypothetical protein CPC16_007370 [Podila verticillata]KAI9233723.1 MAG: hypothetical protein BYD32DRAFT_465049 [Podila humilis]
MPFEADTTSNTSSTSKYTKMEDSNSQAVLDPPVVLIAGAGLGGLMAALLLEKANINYFVFERAAKVKPLGSVISLSPNILPCFQQLGLLQEMEKISLTCDHMELYHQNLERIGSVDGRGFTEITGYKALFFSRPDLYNFLLSKIPPSKIFMSKKILSILQNDEGVMIRCSDNTHYHGDILIGADGAYSGVRQSMYKQMDELGLLPAVDKEDMSVGYICMVGTTGPLDPEKYPALKDSRCHFATILSKDTPHSWSTATVSGHRLAWSAKVQLDKATAKDMMFRNSEWGPESNQAMIDELYNFPTIHGGKLGDLIDATDKDNISKVYIEEKMFQTWNYGRTVLIGDAAHKMQPSGGQGAVAAMQDAVILVNCIYDIENITFENIKAALASYKSQRFEKAQEQVNMSKMLGKIIFGHKWTERMLRTVIYNLPKWAQDNTYTKMATYRPMIAFLPPVPNVNNIKLLPQRPSTRYAKELANVMTS